MLRRWIPPLALAGLLALIVLRREARRRNTPVARRPGWPVNIGHRGAPRRRAENTLASFREALAAGAGGLELDVHLTRDGQLVVMHDASVDRTTDGEGRILGLTVAEIRGLKTRDPDGMPGGSGVPTLAEVLGEFPDAVVNIDIKDAGRPGAVAAVLDALRGAGAEGRVLVASEHHAVIRRFREVSGGAIDTGASRCEIATFLALSALRLEPLARPAYAALQVPTSYGGLPIVTRRFVEAAHRRGVRVDVWTIDEPEEMHRLLDLGVDAVMTNTPELLAAVLAERHAGRHAGRTRGQGRARG